MINNEEIYKDAGILMQVVTTIAVIMFVLLYLISNINAFVNIIGLLIGVLMLTMAFNNHVTFKRKYFTLIYFIVGIFSIVISLMGYFG